MLLGVLPYPELRLNTSALSEQRADDNLSSILLQERQLPVRLAHLLRKGGSITDRWDVIAALSL
jgi:hypothetical protein